ncbi:polygalacturonase [Dorcoceras hygrometricum]|uniref:Polygalacturonase n=1 Tax=Dorcoceras hygrometricum TaxID=472368 RepID=A0A2Z7APV0_9LAMI|nr:polygalacturonase [Dorcoceras hygrometricum]
MKKYIHIYLSLSLCVILNFNSYTLLAANRGKNVPKRNDSVFNVLEYGARGDGSSYDTKAFQAAWTATCKANGGVMVVPSGHTFLLQPIIFNGDKCQPNVAVQVDGIIVASTNKLDWKKNTGQWILFTKYKNGITISGNGGVFDGHGQTWWNPKADHERLVAPHAMTISNCNNVTITGIRIQNSPRMHIYIEESQEVKVFNVTVSSPGNSSNTDGIHLSRSQHVDIHNSTLACGDDCISIQAGCSDIKVYNVNCGPGHGYSIGGLGYRGSRALVSDIMIYDSNVQDSMTGVRIKTWEGGSGSVHNVTFSSITMTDVKTPITIDQHYGGARGGMAEASAVSITGITYQNITGTYTRTSVSLLCSEYKPCNNLTMAGIHLMPSKDKKQGRGGGPYCSHAYGEVLTETLPSLHNCLQPILK